MAKISSQGTDRARQWRLAAELTLPAVTIVFGLQAWRALVPLLVAVIRNRFGFNAAVVGTVAFAVLLSGFIAGPLHRRLGSRRAMAISAGGTGLLRLAMQLWTGDPALELGLALFGSVLFILALVGFTSGFVSRGHGHSSRFAVGALLGLALDLALHGFWRTYDLSWQDDTATLLVTGALFLVQAALLRREVKGVKEGGNRELSPFPNVVWLAVGPSFLLALLAWQSVARLTVMTGWAQAPVFLWMAAVQALTLAGVIWLLRRAPANVRLLAGAGLVLLFGSLLPAWPAGVWAAAGYLLGHAGSALALVGLLRGLSARHRPTRWRGVALVQAVTVFLFALILYLYHFQYGDPASPSPFASRLLPLVSGVLLAIPVLSVTWSASDPMPGQAISWRPALLATALLALPLVRLVTVQRPPEGNGHLPLRTMTYNLHNGFDVDGHLGLEALAAVIEAEEPDVVMLQEISRGLIIYSPTDMLTWLARRLDMHAHFTPTADALWGLGTLSRVPIVEGGGAALPPDDLLIRRGVEWIVVDVGEGRRLTVVNTHFHHPQRGGDVRVLQAQAVVEAWQGTSPLIVGGDLNARPETPEIEHFVDAGWKDVVGTNGPQPGYTFSSPAPFERIDYLWLSPDLATDDVAIPTSTASDHLPVVATVRPANDNR